MIVSKSDFLHAGLQAFEKKIFSVTRNATSKRQRKARSNAQCEYPGALISCADFTLTTLGYLVMGVIEDALHPLGLRLREYRLLRILLTDGPQRQNALGAQLGIDRTTAVELIDGLESDGLAKRERDVEDRRAYCISLTTKGRRTVAKAIDKLAKTEALMFGPLKARERDELHRLTVALLTEAGPIAEQHRREFQSIMTR